MSLKKQIEEKLNEALKAKDKSIYPTLRLVVSAIKDAEIAARTKGQKEISDSDIMAILKKMIKQRNESCEVYKKAGRNELLENETKEIEVISNFLPKQLQNIKTIGRLDYNSEGLLMLTNDGDFSRYIELPKNNFKRIYKVRVFGKINEKRLHNLSNGIKINGESFKPLDVIIEKRQKSNSWLNFTLYEGRNREIRKICKYMDLEVSRLIRYSYGPFNLGNLNKCGIKKVPNSFLIRKLPKFFK